MSLKSFIKQFLKNQGYSITKSIDSEPYEDIPKSDLEIINSIKPFTMTSVERCFSLLNATRYVVKKKIPGDIVECGVWKGGSMMLVAKILKQMNSQDKELYLFDTFEGMPIPTEEDKSSLGSAIDEFLEKQIDQNSSMWCNAPIDEVKKLLFSTKYSQEKINFIKGKVEDTIQLNKPKQISLLRLDTDWYKSTKYELEQLFPLLSEGGVLIIDDYGYWEGARKAVDEYFLDNKIEILLNRIDSTGRIAIKI